jgi:heme/copper-type cytochrome/quinol oxidase subunit 2
MKPKYAATAVVAILAVAAAVTAAALPSLNVTSGTHTTGGNAPPGCVKPAGGFLIVANLLGFNDSVDHGVPSNSWPVMNVKVGQNVTIVVCNEDPTQAHGFNIQYYYDQRIVSLASGQVLKVSFIADKAGSFWIKCNIFCTVHWAMQSGKLVVS